MEEDILNYSPTLMFRGTPCIKKNFNLNDSEIKIFTLENKQNTAIFKLKKDLLVVF